jgi:futalosine hydrolase
MIGLICSVEIEYEDLLSSLYRGRHVEYGGLIFWRGFIHDEPVILAASGVGKTNAAHAASVMAEKYHPSLVINFGVGGAYAGSGLHIGDLAIATKEIYGDEGVVVSKGFKGMRDIGIPLIDNSVAGTSRTGRKSKVGKNKSRALYNKIPLSGDLVNKVKRRLKKSTFTVTPGPFVTLSAVTGGPRRARELYRRYRAVCENMEGASVAHISFLHGMPFVEIRGISNIVGDRDKRRWKLKEAAAECQGAITELLREGEGF